MSDKNKQNGGCISVSVIVPIYNKEVYLEKCLNSIQLQTLSNIEIILINDGSKDDSFEICHQFAKRDCRFVYIEQKNKGLAESRNVGMRVATGEYIAFIDADDWIDQQMFEKMFSVAQKHSADVVCCNCYTENGIQSVKNRPTLTQKIYDEEMIKNLILPDILSRITSKGYLQPLRWSNCLRLHRLSLIKENNLYYDSRFRLSEDLQLSFEEAMYAKKYVYLADEYLYHNRIVLNSLSRGYNTDMWYKLKLVLERILLDIKKEKLYYLLENFYFCVLYCAINTANNEIDCLTNQYSDKSRVIRGMCSDEYIRLAISKINVSKLNLAMRLYIFGIKHCSSFVIFCAFYYKKWVEHFKRKVVALYETLKHV